MENPLIAKVQNIINQDLKLDKLNDEDISSVVDIKNGKGNPDQCNLGWSVKSEMLRACIEKVINSGNVKESDYSEFNLKYK